uniref:Uncharacterized protein n=1 Tax=Setaria italica TaxID=4555 RepID=K3Y4I8_SETIT
MSPQIFKNDRVRSDGHSRNKIGHPFCYVGEKFTSSNFRST